MGQKGIAPRVLTSKSLPVDLGEVRIRILNPEALPPGRSPANGETNECALATVGRRLLSAKPDIGESTEPRVVARAGALRRGVLPRRAIHGSAYSGTESFLRAVRPEAIVISAGRRGPGEDKPSSATAARGRRLA